MIGGEMFYITSGYLRRDQKIIQNNCNFDRKLKCQNAIKLMADDVCFDNAGHLLPRQWRQDQIAIQLSQQIGRFFLKNAHRAKLCK